MLRDGRCVCACVCLKGLFDAKSVSAYRAIDTLLSINYVVMVVGPVTAVAYEEGLLLNTSYEYSVLRIITELPACL